MGETWSHEALTGKGGEIEERPEGWSEVSEEMEGLVSRAQMEGLISLGKEGSLVSLCTGRGGTGAAAGRGLCC